MYGKVIAAVAAFVGCMFVLGVTFDIFRMAGHPISQSGFFPLLVIISAIAVVAAFGRESTEPWIEVCRVLAFAGIALIFSTFFGPIGLFAILAGVIVVYGYPALAGWNYLFIRRPIEQRAMNEQSFSAKLNADTELAEAMMRHERARAALAEAEDAVAKAEPTERPHRP